LPQRDSQDDSPIIAQDTATSSLKEPNAASEAVLNDAFKNFNAEQLNWLPLKDIHTTGDGLPSRHLDESTYGRPGDSSSSAYMNSGSSNGADTGLSPDTGHSGSNRPTPNSASPSEIRVNLQSKSDLTHEARLQGAEVATSHSPFSAHLEHRGVSTTGLTPNSTFGIPATPGRDFPAPGWELGGQATGLTPIGEGVFRQLYGLGPMDLGWEGNPES
jgi:hypothetical protein